MAIRNETAGTILQLVAERTAKQAQDEFETVQLFYDAADKQFAEQDANKAVCTAAKQDTACQKKIASGDLGYLA